MNEMRNKLFTAIIPCFIGAAFIEALFDILYSSNLIISVLLRSLQIGVYLFIYLGAIKNYLTEDNRLKILLTLSFVFASLFSLISFLTIGKYTYYWFGGLLEYLLLLSLFINRKSKWHMESIIVSLIFSFIYAVVTYYIKGKLSFVFAFYLGYIFFVLNIVNSIFQYQLDNKTH